MKKPTPLQRRATAAALDHCVREPPPRCVECVLEGTLLFVPIPVALHRVHRWVIVSFLYHIAVAAAVGARALTEGTPRIGICSVCLCIFFPRLSPRLILVFAFVNSHVIRTGIYIQRGIRSRIHSFGNGTDICVSSIDGSRCMSLFKRKLFIRRFSSSFPASSSNWCPC